MTSVIVIDRDWKKIKKYLLTFAKSYFLYVYDKLHSYDAVSWSPWLCLYLPSFVLVWWLQHQLSTDTAGGGEVKLVSETETQV